MLFLVVLHKSTCMIKQRHTSWHFATKSSPPLFSMFGSLVTIQIALTIESATATSLLAEEHFHLKCKNMLTMVDLGASRLSPQILVLLLVYCITGKGWRLARTWILQDVLYGESLIGCAHIPCMILNTQELRIQVWGQDYSNSPHTQSGLDTVSGLAFLMFLQCMVLRITVHHMCPAHAVSPSCPWHRI
jgi:hypothetical protein